MIYEFFSKCPCKPIIQGWANIFHRACHIENFIATGVAYITSYFTGEGRIYYTTVTSG